MNPLTNVRNIKKLTETELQYNISGKASWHYQYKDSAWIFIGGLPYDLSEGDVICIFSQYGEVVNINLVRDKGTGKSKGFCFLCYEDQRSTILAVDNLNSIKVCGRTLRVDHVEQYKIPKDPDKLDQEALLILQEGCGPNSSVIKTLQAPKPAAPPPLSPKLSIKKEKEAVENETRTTSKEQRARSKSPKTRNSDGRSRDERSPERKPSDHHRRERSREKERHRPDRRERSREREATRNKDRKDEKERSSKKHRSDDKRDKRDRSRDRSRERDRKHRRH